MSTERRSDAPPYRGEGVHALWHVSAHDGIPRFEPRVSSTSSRKEPLVWAIDTRHLPLFWFPRSCPRGTFWADPQSRPEDVEIFLSGQQALRVHAIEAAWLERVRDGRVLAYRMPEATFEPDPTVGGYWTSRTGVTPLECEPMDDFLTRHAEAGIELRRPVDLAALGSGGRVDARFQRHPPAERATALTPQGVPLGAHGPTPRA